MAFSDDVKRFETLTTAKSRRVFERASEIVFASIVEGSPITGSLGQRVDTGFLRGSWRNILEGPGRRIMATPVAYAPLFEGQPYDPKGTQRPAGMLSRGPSTVGLADYSVLLTRLAWGKVVETAAAEVANA